MAISYSSPGDTAAAHVAAYNIDGTLGDGTGLAGDYTVTLNPGTLSVNPYAFSSTIPSDSQTYGSPANLAADLPATIATGVNNELLAISYSSPGDTATAHVAAYNIDGTLGDGTGLAGDYTVTLNPGTLSVNPYAFSSTIPSDSQTYGSPANLAADLPATIATGVNNELLAISYSSPGDTATAHVAAYNIDGTLGDGTGLAGDYTVTLNPGTLSVNPYAFSSTIPSDSQTYGSPANLAADLPATIATGVNGENLAISYSQPRRHGHGARRRLQHRRHAGRRHGPGGRLHGNLEPRHAFGQSLRLQLDDPKRQPDLRQPGQPGRRPARHHRHRRQRREFGDQLQQPRRHGRGARRRLQHRRHAGRRHGPGGRLHGNLEPRHAVGQSLRLQLDDR